MSWKFVFNTMQFLDKNILDRTQLTGPSSVAKIASEAGYQFFTWDKQVYYIPTINSPNFKTNILISDLF